MMRTAASKWVKPAVTAPRSDSRLTPSPKHTRDFTNRSSKVRSQKRGTGDNRGNREEKQKPSLVFLCSLSCLLFDFFFRISDFEFFSEPIPFAKIMVRLMLPKGAGDGNGERCFDLGPGRRQRNAARASDARSGQARRAVRRTIPDLRYPAFQR